MFHARRRLSEPVVWVSLATALLGITLLTGMRFLTLKAVEPFFMPVTVATLFVSILMSPRFTGTATADK
jgi:hypothetical protein